MAFHGRRNRFRRVLLWFLGIILGGVLWKAAWRFGPGLAGDPGGSPALFGVQAQVLLKANLKYPKRVEAILPAPEKGTSAEAQLRLMELWDGKAWTAKATKSGRVAGKLLRVAAGRITFGRITAISSERLEDGKKTCRIDYRLRWDWPDQDRELLRVAAIVGLRTPAPAGFGAPGQEAAAFLILERDGWGWRLQGARAELGAPGGDSPWSYLAWLF